MPQTRLLKPTVRPPPKIMWPAAIFFDTILAPSIVFGTLSRSNDAYLPTKTNAIIMPKIATASQKTIETRFFVRIRGALTAPPRIEEPVVKMPLKTASRVVCVDAKTRAAHQAAPRTESDSEAAMPRLAHLKAAVRRAKVSTTP